MNKKTPFIIFALFVLAIPTKMALAADFTVTGGGVSITYPQKRWLRDYVTVTNTSGKYLELTFTIDYPKSQQSFAGFPQPNDLYLQPDESQKIYFFMDELWGNLRDLPQGSYELPVIITIGPRNSKGPDGKIQGGQTFTITEKVNAVSGQFQPTGTMAQNISSDTKFTLTKFIATDDWGIYRADLSSDGGYLATTPGYCQVPKGKDLYLRLFSIPEGKELLKYKLPAQTWGVSVSKNGSYIAYGADDSEMAVLDKNGNKIFSKSLSSKEVRLNDEGVLLAVGSQFGYVFLYDIPSGNLRWQKFVRGQVRALRFYKNDSKLLVGSGDGYLYQLDVSSGNQDWKADVETWPFQHIGVSPDEKRIIVGGKVDPATIVTDTGAALWKKYVDGAVHWVDLFSDYSAMIDGGFYDKDGNQKWITGGWGNITGKIFQDKYIVAGGDFVLVADKNGILWQWNPKQHDEVQRMVRFAEATPDGKTIVASGYKADGCSTGFVAILQGSFGPAKNIQQPAVPTSKGQIPQPTSQQLQPSQQPQQNLPSPQPQTSQQQTELQKPTSTPVAAPTSYTQPPKQEGVFAKIKNAIAKFFRLLFKR